MGQIVYGPYSFSPLWPHSKRTISIFFFQLSPSSIRVSLSITGKNNEIQRANRTDPAAKNIKGTNPQNLVEKILLSKIYQHTYWKEQCFGLTAETLLDGARSLRRYLWRKSKTDAVYVLDYEGAANSARERYRCWIYKVWRL
jgi:hypothetical protein